MSNVSIEIKARTAFNYYIQYCKTDI